jgi:capsular polysaccharide transport system permease protein
MGILNVFESWNFRRYESVAGTAAVGAGARPRILGQLARLTGLINIWFWAIVGLPTLIAAVYFFGIASSLYLSEVKFIVHAPAKMQLGGIGALLSSAASTPGIEDTYAISDFIMSRDAVSKLDADANLRLLFGRRDGDLLSRFPGVLSFGRNDFEALYKAYSRFVAVEIDSQSGIATIDVKAYRPEDAQKIARNLIAYSEQLVNELNDRAHRDALATFQRQVDEIQKKIETVQAQLTDYRVQQNMLDPKSAAAGPLELVAKLIAQQTAAQTQLADIMKNSPHSPQIPLIKTRIASLNQAIDEARGKITGASNSVASVQSQYERLTVELGLDERALASAFTSLESARLEAQRQQLYLETIVQPNLADYPIYPKRMVSFLVVTVSCLLLYGIAWLLVASVREHASA